MITDETVEGLLEHITVRKVYYDGKLSAYELTAHEGYCLHFKDTTEEPPHYSLMIFMSSDCDLNSVEAILITDENREYVHGNPDKPEVE